MRSVLLGAASASALGLIVAIGRFVAAKLPRDLWENPSGDDDRDEYEDDEYGYDDDDDDWDDERFDWQGFYSDEEMEEWENADAGAGWEGGPLSKDDY